MEIYKTVRNIVLGSFVAALPYICEGGCEYFNKNAKVAMIISQKQQVTEKQSLEELAAVSEI